MQDRVSRKGTAAAAMALEADRSETAKPARMILGIDPSLRGTGLGVLDLQDLAAPRACHFEVVKCPTRWTRSRCLARIAEATRDTLIGFQPEVCVVEGLFYAQNLQTALIMGEARGACLAAVATAGLDIYELAPRRVKQAIVGYGAAGKDAVARMVQRLLGLDEIPPDDAADALALALVFAQEQKRLHLAAPKRV
jgi:crossover junction endodeoxyribonuclease RuvC